VVTRKGMGKILTVPLKLITEDDTAKKNVLGSRNNNFGMIFKATSFRESKTDRRCEHVTFPTVIVQQLVVLGYFYCNILAVTYHQTT
jgi:hypothetical protein